MVAHRGDRLLVCKNNDLALLRDGRKELHGRQEASLIDRSNWSAALKPSTWNLLEVLLYQDVKGGFFLLSIFDILLNYHTNTFWMNLYVQYCAKRRMKCLEGDCGSLSWWITLKG